MNIMGSAKIKIDKDLLEKAEKYSEKAGYSSVEEFVEHLIQRELSGSGDAEGEEVLKERLRGLGYIS